MMRGMTIAALVLTLTAGAAAQDAGRRGGWGGPGAGGGPRQWIEQMLEGFDHELAFNEQQWEQLATVVDAQEARMQEGRAKWEEVGAAMAAGEEDRAAELREALMRDFNEREGGMREMFDEIENVLDAEQFDRFVDMRRLMQDWRDHGREMWQAVRELPDAVGMTDTQREDYHALQRERWEEMQEEMRQRMEEGGEGAMWEAPDFAALRDDFYGGVSELLDPEQRKLVDEYRAQFAAPEPAPGKAVADDVRTVLRAMKRVPG